MAVILALGGLCPAPEMVNAVLAPEEGVQKRILDLGTCTTNSFVELMRRYAGTGTGIWYAIYLGSYS
jgi:hypothetical protein